MVTLAQLKEDFEPRVREELLAQSKDPDIKPTHRWLREHNFWAVFTYCRPREETVDDVLLGELGFDERPSKPLPGHSVETKRLLHSFFVDESDNFNRVNHSTADDLPTHMRTLMKLCLDTHGHADLTKIARMNRREQYFALRDLFKKLEEHHETQGTAYNYASTLVTFYDWLELRDEIDSHRADEIRDRFDWEYNREGPTYVLTTTEVWQLWKATETLTEKVIIILMFAAGLRPDDIRVLTEDKIHLDPYDPHLEFGPERKNGPGKPVLLAGDDILKRHLELLKQNPDWNGAILPSDQSESGSRSYSFIRSRFDQVVDRSDVTIDHDDYTLTPTAGRDFYMNLLGETRLQYLHGVTEPTMDAAGSSSARVMNKHYLRDRKNRRFFRKYASPYIEAAFEDHAIPPTDEGDQTKTQPGQTKMQDWVNDEDAKSLIGLRALGETVHSSTRYIDRRVCRLFGNSLSVYHASNVSAVGRTALGVTGVTVLATALAIGVQTSSFPLPETAGLLVSSLLIGIASIPD
jgi:integrase